MLFAVILSFGKSTSISLLLMAGLLVLDFRQWLGLTWKKSIGRAVSTGIWYGLMYGAVLLLISFVVLLIVFLK